MRQVPKWGLQRCTHTRRNGGKTPSITKMSSSYLYHQCVNYSKFHNFFLLTSSLFRRKEGDTWKLLTL